MTNAPGRSAFNRVERKMAPLSSQLAGIILPADSFGSHLNESGKTIDTELEKKNFSAAGKALAQIWSALIIDGFSVVAEYKEPVQARDPPNLPDHQWYKDHVRESQYALQIVKCENARCCKPFRSNYLYVLPDRFLPAPCPLRQTSSGIIVPRPADVKKSDRFLPLFQRLNLTVPIKLEPGMISVPYDMYCPSLLSETKQRTCKICGLYFASIKAAGVHSKSIHGSSYNKQACKVRPARVATRRCNELLCVIRDENTGAENVDWIDEDDVDAEDDFVPQSVGEYCAEIKEVEAWATNEFTTDD